jgi:hypothetical protein
MMRTPRRRLSAHGCPFRERSTAVPPRACLTAKARAETVRLVSGDNRSIASVAASFGVSWDTVMRAVRDDAQRVLATTTGTGGRVRPGRDRMNPSRSHTRRRYLTVFVDLDRHRDIDVVAGRHAAAVTGWLEQQDPAWRELVTTVATGGVPSARVEAISLRPSRLPSKEADPEGRLTDRGFTNFDNYRARIISRLGQTGRLPQPPDSEAQTPSPWQRDPPSRRAPEVTATALTLRPRDVCR